MLGALMSMAVTGLVVSGASAQGADPAVPSPVVSGSDGAALAIMVNEYRVANGLNPLVIDQAFTARTEAHAQLLSSLNPTPAPPAGYDFWCPETSQSTFYHDTVDNQLASAPAGSVAYGENIAFRCSTSFATHAGDIMTGWQESPGHNTNMLNPTWTHIASVAIRWNNSTIAVQRFASVPGTPVPAATNVATPGVATAADPGSTAAVTTTADTTTTATGSTAAVAADATATTDAGTTAATTTADAATTTDAGTTDAATTDAAITDTTATTDTTAAATTTDAATTDAATTADTTTTDAAATTAEAATAPAAPQLAFTGTNLNLAAAGIALIVVGLGILWLPSVRRFSDQE